MKLNQVLEEVNSFEKNSFLKIINDIISNDPKGSKAINAVLSDSSSDLKNTDSSIVSQVFELVHDEYRLHVNEAFLDASSQLDILIDILIRDGKCVMKLDWFSRLYENEIKALKKKVKAFEGQLESGSKDISDSRLRDYRIYKNCVSVAFTNDDLNNSDRKITSDELSLLVALSRSLSLSQEEIKLINYSVLPIELLPIDQVINDLKSKGVLFYSKKTNTIYVPDELVKVLRSVRGKEISDKHYRRTALALRDAQVNLACRIHGIDWKQDNWYKINELVKNGVSFREFLLEDIHKEGLNLTDRKKELNDLFEKGLRLGQLKGSTIEEKVDNIVQYFQKLELDEKLSIAMNGYERLVSDLDKTLKKSNTLIRKHFELQEEYVLNAELLVNYNLKPRDILEILDSESLTKFCESIEISTRGDEVTNIIEAYKDTENIFIENYELLAFRDLNELKRNGLALKESEVGLKFEELTGVIFSRLGFNVDEALKKGLNSSKDKMDLIINLGGNEVIIVECKTKKDSGYNKFSSVSRQLKSYAKLAQGKGYNVIKSLLVGPEFSDDFIADCELEYELNLSLLTAQTLKNILQGFEDSKLQNLPYNLLMRDVLIQESRVLKALKK